MKLAEIKDKIAEIRKVENHDLWHMPKLPQETNNAVKVYLPYTKDGVNEIHSYCFACGKEENNIRGYYGYGRTCGKCGERNLVSLTGSGSFTEKMAVILYVDKEEEYAIGATVEIAYSTKIPSNEEVYEFIKQDNWEFLKTPFTLNREYAKYGDFFFVSRNEGIRIWDHVKFSLLMVGSLQYEHTLRTIRDLEVFGYVDEMIAALGFDAGTSVNEALKIIDMEKAKERAAKTAHKKAAINLNNGYKPMPFTMKAPKADYNPIVVLTSFGDVKECAVTCSECNTTHKITINENTRESKTFTCPHCGATKDTRYVTAYQYRSKIHVGHSNHILFDVDSSENLVVRYFENELFLDKEKGIVIETSEHYRIFYTPKRYFLYEHTDKGYEKASIVYTPSLYISSENRASIIPQTSQEIIDIINKSALRYSGLIEAWELKTNKPFERESNPISRGGYLATWYTFPFIEQLIKVGLTNIVYEVCSKTRDNIKFSFINTEGTTVYSILGITRPELKICRQLNLGLNATHDLHRLYNADNTITAELFEELRKGNIIDNVINVNNSYSISIRKIKEYLDSCYNNQCIERQQAMQIWVDYLRMAKNLTYNLGDKNVKFPQSLKKEHDRAVFAYNAIKQELDLKQFKEQAIINKKYEYTYKDFMLRIPETPEEIVQEGQRQKHCVRVYVNRVREGDTVVGFIRYKETPDESYFTVEINNDALVQVRGYCNCAPTDKNLLEFINHFCAAKKLEKHFS